MENINEAPVVAAGTKVVAGLAKAGAKAAAKGGKAASKSSKNISKAASKFKRPNIRSYKDPKTGKVDIDRYRSDQTKYKKIQQDKKNRPDMSNVKPDGVDTKRTERGERKLKAIDKVTDKKKEDIKQGLQVTNAVGQNVATIAGKVVKKTAKAIGSGSSAFGTSSFSKESKITFKDYLNKL
tara:strand:- start:3 stop:545 length:543 start_codon:yes stop_codon:yes gene_type:complete